MAAAPRRTWTHSTTAKDSTAGATRSAGKSLTMSCNNSLGCATCCPGVSWKARHAPAFGVFPSSLGCRPLSPSLPALVLKEVPGSM
ncbi:sodium/potassium-transporting ATPase subunit gamma isoform X6 [Callithrix jacchus]|uniref:sodium/potassium-transporting ATPase subunit gamma isoform X2 n=1 Tax=Callithrix jacchus TaxID=9483 RepID=UPI00083F51E0|nr:sodium/potassium-transporting ATPase subunit gamma isoform X2 [Callithrix jacchus]